MKQTLTQLQNQVKEFYYYLDNHMDAYYEKGNFVASEVIFKLMLKYVDFFHPFEGDE